MPQPDGDEPRVPRPLVRVQAPRRNGGRPRPVGAQYPRGLPPEERRRGAGGAVHGVLPWWRTAVADGRGGRAAGSVIGILKLRLLNKQNSECNALLMNT